MQLSVGDPIVYRKALMEFCEDRGLNPIEYGKGRSVAMAVATLTLCRHADNEEYVAFFKMGF